MLNKERIERGKHWIVCQREDDSADGVCFQDSGLDALEEALAVYEDVAALYEDWHNRAPAHEGTVELRRILERTQISPRSAEDHMEDFGD